VDARRTDGARTSGGKAPIAAQCANTSSQLLADSVEKLENRGAPKISQTSRIGDFSRCEAP
jgi:hypothetical protein